LGNVSKPRVKKDIQYLFAIANISAGTTDSSSFFTDLVQKTTAKNQSSPSHPVTDVVEVKFHVAFIGFSDIVIIRSRSDPRHCPLIGGRDRGKDRGRDRGRDRGKGRGSNT
jgi:hypothetical protein